MIGKTRLFIILLLLLLLTPGIIPAQLLPSQSGTKHHTQVSLLTDVKTIRPGSQFTVGVVMTMDEGWHTYWKNAGEAGIPTAIKWTLPEGFTAGDIQWPLPRKYNESGEVLTYGYEKENMLLVPISVPAGLAAGTTVTLKAEVSWLECEHICIPGSATATLNLPVSNAEPTPLNVGKFERYRAMVPGPFMFHDEVALATQLRPGAVEITLAPRAGTLTFKRDTLPDFYPEGLDEFAIGRTRVTKNGDVAVLRVPLAVYEKVTGPFVLKGVVLYRLESGVRRAGVLEIRLPEEYSATVPIAGEEPQATGILDQPFDTEKAAGGELPMYAYVLFALVGGLLLNIMPCVLPVIALKIFGLVKMSGDHPSQVKKHGVSFSAGIMASFLSLAVLVIVLQAAGDQVGWGFQFQEPLFIITMSAIVFVFGLSLFGVFEVGLLFMLAFAGVGSMLEKKAKEGKGYTASFSEGVFATILATPCTAPFLGTALGFAFVQPAWITMLIFACVGFGMALPYVVLTVKPGWVKFLPKPGEWMVTAKQFMGFLMMGTLLWLLYVLGKQLGMEAVIWTSAFLLVVGIACWILGKYATLNVSRSKYLATWVAAIVLTVAGYWIFMETILDVRSVIAGVHETSPRIPSTDKDGIPWEPFSLATLESHLQGNKTVFVDFTADWCLTCKVNEKTVLTDRKVIERFKTERIVAIKADWTNRNPDITRLLTRFGRSGVPLYVIFPSGRPTSPIVLPEVITSGIVLEAIDRATAGSAALVN